MRRREKVNLYMRIERDGKRLYAVPDLKKQLTVIIGDKPERHDEGVYYLRYEQDGLRSGGPEKGPKLAHLGILVLCAASAIASAATATFTTTSIVSIA